MGDTATTKELLEQQDLLRAVSDFYVHLSRLVHDLENIESEIDLEDLFAPTAPQEFLLRIERVILTFCAATRLIQHIQRWQPFHDIMTSTAESIRTLWQAAQHALDPTYPQSTDGVTPVDAFRSSIWGHRLPYKWACRKMLLDARDKVRESREQLLPIVKDLADLQQAAHDQFQSLEAIVTASLTAASSDPHRDS